MSTKQNLRHAGSKPALTPHDAGTLILVRQGSGGPQVLMGQRHRDLSFMPNKFVFPGGRVSRADSRLVPAAPLRPEVEQKLRYQTRRRNVQALALAAIRETFEETGLLVGRKTAPGARGRLRTRSPSWSPFLARGVVPALDRVEFVARAITPPNRSRRFDARFFLTDADQIQGDLHDTSDGTGELLDLRWFSFDEALELDLSFATRIVLEHVKQRYDRRHPDKRILYMRFVNNERHLELI